MSRRDKLTIAQGLLVGLQGSNATLAMMHGELYITVAVAAVVSAGQYIVHQMALDTAVPGQLGANQVVVDMAPPK